MWGLGLACQSLVNNVLPLKLSSCMSHDAFDNFDCVNKVQVVDCVLCVIDLLIKTLFYAIVCKFTTLILSFEVWGLGLGLEDLWPWPWPCIGWPWPWRPPALALALYCLALALALTLLALLTSLAVSKFWTRSLQLKTVSRYVFWGCHCHLYSVDHPPRQYLVARSWCHKRTWYSKGSEYSNKFSEISNIDVFGSENHEAFNYISVYEPLLRSLEAVHVQCPVVHGTVGCTLFGLHTVQQTA